MDESIFLYIVLVESGENEEWRELSDTKSKDLIQLADLFKNTDIRSNIDSLPWNIYNFRKNGVDSLYTWAHGNN